MKQLEDFLKRHIPMGGKLEWTQLDVEAAFIAGFEAAKDRTITLTSGGGACPELYWGTTDNGDSVFIRFRWGCALLDINNTVVHMKDYDDPYRGYFQDGELEAFVKEAGYKFIPLF